jgi:hypothetical protein
VFKVVSWREDGQGYFDFSKIDVEQILAELREVNLERDSKRINLHAYNIGQGGDYWTESKALSWKESTWTILSVKKYQLCKELVENRHLETYEAVYQEIQNEIEPLLGLTDKGMMQFAEIHKKHVSAWESPERIKQHSLANIQKVKWVKEENCFHVFYKKTERFSSEWYHYTLTGDWY